jgi:hypothetical protein
MIHRKYNFAVVVPMANEMDAGMSHDPATLPMFLRVWTEDVLSVTK